jgi:hypothetical protein
LYRDSGYSRDDWNKVHGNALKAKKESNMTTLQVAILTYPKDMSEIIKALDEAAPIIKKLEDPGMHFLKDFLATEVLNLEGLHLVKADGKYVVERVKLKELLWKDADSHGVFGMYNSKTMIFNGRSYMGKSEFCHLLARELALRKEKPAYGWGTIDKYGAVTKAGQMNAMGCFVFDDFALATRGGGHRLSVEEVKHLLYVKQRGTVHAFYGDAIFPEAIPRVWCINYKTAEQPEYWFDRENANDRTTGLIHLQLGNSAFFNDPMTDEGAIAVARRAFIFTVHRPLFSESAALSHASDMRNSAEEEEARGTPMPSFL